MRKCKGVCKWGTQPVIHSNFLDRNFRLPHPSEPIAHALPRAPTQPIKVRTGRYGELEEHELIHLLDSLDDERSKARFRESIYISLIIYLGIVWFLFYGPRVLFHQPKLISPVDVLKERDKQLTFLDN